MTQQELLIQALKEQRNEAYDRGAQLAAIAAELQTKVNELENTVNNILHKPVQEIDAKQQEESKT